MTTDDHHDPVNRWATEHYGFEEPAGAEHEDREAAAGEPAVASAGPPPASGVAPASRRRSGLIVGGIVSLALAIGLGGVSVATAAASDDGGRGGPPDSGRGRVVQVDDDGPSGPGGDRR